METKDQLVDSIKQWILLDNEINEHKKKIKDLTFNKKTLSSSLLNTMKTNQIECFDIKDGALVYKQNKVKKPINAKTLLNTLKTYYNKTPDKADEITKFILDNREEQIRESLKRQIYK